MKIAFIGKYPPTIGGESTKLYWLAKALGERGNECMIISDCQEREDKSPLSLEDLVYLQPKNVKLFSTSKITIEWYEESFKTERLADLSIRATYHENPDVIVGWYLVPYGIASFLASKFTNKPLILQHAGSDMKRFFGSSNLKSLLINQFASAKGIMAYPSYYFSLRFLNENVFLHNPKINVSEIENSQNFNLPEELIGKKLITFLGKISRAKGAFDLLRAYEILGESKEFALVYVGNGMQKKELEVLVREKGFKNVFIYPPLPPWRVPGFLRKSSVFFVGERNFYVSRHFSRKPMEALLCKSPLLISSEMKQKGIYKNLISGIHCIEINPYDIIDVSKKLKILLDNPFLAKEISENGYEFAKRANEGFEDYIEEVENFLRIMSY